MIDCYHLGSGHRHSKVNYKQDSRQVLLTCITTYEGHIYIVGLCYGYLIPSLTTFQL